MNTPFFTFIAATFYFGWLWHNRTAAEHAKRGSSNGRVEKFSPTGAGAKSIAHRTNNLPTHAFNLMEPEHIERKPA